MQLLLRKEAAARKTESRWYKMLIRMGKIGNGFTAEATGYAGMFFSSARKLAKIYAVDLMQNCGPVQ